ncbi:MAG TPA: hypothetical protein VFG46_13795 [Chryseolinea sp.]|nr:hypothetical protein [Chryseolinea sp.]
MRQSKAVRISLIGVAILLLLVGIESGTVGRHLIQIIPIISVIPIVTGENEHGKAAAMGVLFFWLIIMVLIWLHVLNIAHALNGTFTTIEIILTVLIAAMSLLGIYKATGHGFRTSYLLFFIFFTSLFFAYGFASLSYGRFFFIN